MYLVCVWGLFMYNTTLLRGFLYTTASLVLFSRVTFVFTHLPFLPSHACSRHTARSISSFAHPVVPTTSPDRCHLTTSYLASPEPLWSAAPQSNSSHCEITSLDLWWKMLTAVTWKQNTWLWVCLWFHGTFMFLGCLDTPPLIGCLLKGE